MAQRKYEENHHFIINPYTGEDYPITYEKTEKGIIARAEVNGRKHERMGANEKIAFWSIKTDVLTTLHFSKHE